MMKPIKQWNQRDRSGRRAPFDVAPALAMLLALSGPLAFAGKTNSEVIDPSVRRKTASAPQQERDPASEPNQGAKEEAAAARSRQSVVERPYHHRGLAED